MNKDEIVGRLRGERAAGLSTETFIETKAIQLHWEEAIAHADVTHFGTVWDWDDVHPQVREKHMARAKEILSALQTEIASPND